MCVCVCVCVCFVFVFVLLLFVKQSPRSSTQEFPITSSRRQIPRVCTENRVACARALTDHEPVVSSVTHFPLSTCLGSPRAKLRPGGCDVIGDDVLHSMLMAHLSRVMGPIVSAMITLHALGVPMALWRVYCINCNLARSGRCETSSWPTCMLCIQGLGVFWWCVCLFFSV